MCGSDTTDPLARTLFKEHRLILVSTAFLRSELAPGKVVVTYPSGMNRSPVVYPLDSIVEVTPSMPVIEAPFHIFTLTERSRAVEASIALEAAGILGDSIDIKGLEAALQASGARKFQISLLGPVRADLDLSVVEQALRSTKLSATGLDLYERGCGLHLVVRTIAANKVSLEADAALDLAALLKVAPFGDGKAKASLKSARVIAMQRMESEMVVGFGALRIERVDDELFLAGLARTLDTRGPRDRSAEARFSLPADLGEANSLFVAPVKAV
jgi:hypothetical protein